MSRRVKVIVAATAVIASVLVTAALALFAATGSVWGRRQLARVLEWQVGGLLAEGVRLRVGALHGGLGGTWSADSLSLVDAAGHTVISIHRASVDLAVAALLGGDVRLGTIVIDGARVHLVQLPNGSWNVNHLWRARSPGRTPNGPRRMVRADSMALIDAQLELRSLDTRASLPLRRQVFSGINIAFGATTFSSRDSAGGWSPVRALQLAIDDPPVTVVSAAGGVRWWSDSMRIDVPLLRLPASRARVNGTIAWPSQRPVSVALDVRADSVSVADVRWMSTLFPHAGDASASVAVRSAAGGGFRYDISAFDLRANNSHISGSLAIALGRHTEVTDLALELQPLDLALVRNVFGDTILKPAWRGAISGRVRGRGGRLDSLRIDTAAVTFSDARVRGARSRLAASGAVDASGAGTRLIGMALRIDSIDVRTLGAVVHAADSLHGVLAGRVTLDGPTKNITFRDLWLQHVDGARARSTVSGSGRIASDIHTPWLAAALSLDTLAVATLFRDRSSLPLRGLASGTLNVRATGDTLTLDATARSGDASAHLSGTALLDSTRTRLLLTGTITGFDPRTFIARREIPAMAVNGGIELDIDDGKLQVDRHVAIRIDSTSRIGDSRVWDGVVRFGLDSAGFHMDTADVRADGWRLDARGRLARTGAATTDSVTFNAAVDSLGVLRTLLLDSTGAPRFTQFEGRLRAENGVLRGSFESLSLHADLGAEQITLETLGIRRAAATVALRDLPEHATGLVRGTVDSLTARGIGVDLATVAARFENGERIRLSASASTGDTIRIAAEADVSWPDDGFHIRLDTLTSSIGEHRWRLQAPALLQVTATTATVDSLVMRSDHGANVGAFGSVSDQGAINASLRIAGLGFEELAFLGIFPADLSGRLAAAANISGTRDAPIIAASAALDSIRSADRDRPALAFGGTYAARNASVKFDATIGGRQVMQLSGDIPLDLSLRAIKDRIIDAPMDVIFRADSMPLADFEALAPRISGLGGSLQAAVNVRGSLRRPSGRGSLHLSNGAFELPKFGFAARDAELSLELAGDSLLVKRLRMSDSDSPTDTASLTGTVLLTGSTWSEWTVALQSMASRFRVIDDPRLATAEASWQVRVTGALGAPRVTGSVRLPYALFTIGSQKRTRTTARGSADGRRLGMPQVDGVTVTLGSDVRLKSKDANVQLSGDVELFGSLDKPWISGQVSATRGTYRVDLGLIKRTFRVDSGAVILEGTSDIPAALDIFTSYTVRRADQDDISIGAHLYGTTDRPRLALSSDLGSAVGQSEIISYLVFGQSSFGLDPARQSTVRTATAALVPSLGGMLEGVLGTLLPFFSTLQVSTVAGDGPQNVAANPLEGVLNSFAVTGGRQIGTDSFFSVSGGVCRGSRVSSTASAPFWLGTAMEYRPKRTVGGTISIDPGPAPCASTGNFADKYQIGLDLSYEWNSGRTRKP